MLNCHGGPHYSTIRWGHPSIRNEESEVQKGDEGKKRKTDDLSTALADPLVLRGRTLNLVARIENGTSAALEFGLMP